jgi:hypothetical protein
VRFQVLPSPLAALKWILSSFPYGRRHRRFLGRSILDEVCSYDSVIYHTCYIEGPASS